jgi:hypothetical protein
MPRTTNNSATHKPMLQGTGTNTLMTVNTRRRKPEIDLFIGSATLRKSENYTIFFENYNEQICQLRPSLQKLLSLLTIQLTAQNNYSKNGGDPDNPNSFVTITLEDYMNMCGITETKGSTDMTRDALKQDIEALFRVSIDWYERRGTKMHRYAQMRIIDQYELKNGVLRAHFSQPMAQYLTQAYIMEFPLALLKTDDRNPNVFSLGYKLAFHYGLRNNRKNNRHNFISVEALLSSCADIPSYEEASENRQTKQRIIKPFERAMNQLVNQGVLEIWKYCDSERNLIDNYKAEKLPYSELESLYVIFEMAQDNTYISGQNFLTESV